MSYGEGIVLAFVCIWKTAQPLLQPNAFEFFSPTGYQFMRIALMPYVPEQSVVPEIEAVVQGQAQLYDSQVAGQMSAVLGHSLADYRSYFLGQLIQLLRVQFVQVCRRIYMIQ